MSPELRSVLLGLLSEKISANADEGFEFWRKCFESCLNYGDIETCQALIDGCGSGLPSDTIEQLDYFQACTYLKCGEWQRAIDLCRQYIESESCASVDKAKAYHALGAAHEGQKDEDQAIASYLQCLDLKEKYGPPHAIPATLACLADLYWKKEQVSKAQDLYGRIISHPESSLEEKAHVQLSLGQICKEEGNTSGAIDHLQKASGTAEKAGLDPMLSARISEELALAYQTRGDFDKAKEFLKKAVVKVQEEGDDRWLARVYKTLAEVLLVAGDYPEALDYYERAAKLLEGLTDEILLVEVEEAIVSCEAAASDPEKSGERLLGKIREIQQKGFQDFAGSSSRIFDPLNRAFHFARVDVPVLILGESGTGKDVLARAIHRNSPRAQDIYRIIENAAASLDALKDTVIKKKIRDTIVTLTSLSDKVDAEFVEIHGFVPDTHKRPIADLDEYLRTGARSDNYEGVTDPKLRRYMAETVWEFDENDRKTVARVILVIYALWHSNRMFNFIPVNCATVDPDAKGGFNRVLFGAVPGAFTGVWEATGKFQIASYQSATIFINEIGDLPLGAQGSLLRVIEGGHVERLGAAGSKPEHVDVRIIAATNKNLREEVRLGRFRADLYNRLNHRIRLPALRERKEDIPELAEHLLADCLKEVNKENEIRGFSRAALRCLCDYSWPKDTNVRMLRDIIKDAVIFCDGSSIRVEDVKQAINQTDGEEVIAGGKMQVQVRPAEIKRIMSQFRHPSNETERAESKAAATELIMKAYQAGGKKKNATARALGIRNRQTLDNYLRDLDISLT